MNRHSPEGVCQGTFLLQPPITGPGTISHLSSLIAYFTLHSSRIMSAVVVLKPRTLSTAEESIGSGRSRSHDRWTEEVLWCVFRDNCREQRSRRT